MTAEEKLHSVLDSMCTTGQAMYAARGTSEYELYEREMDDLRIEFEVALYRLPTKMARRVFLVNTYNTNLGRFKKGLLVIKAILLDEISKN